MFAAFAPGFGNPIAGGGRYDHIGEVFGRARPATGFAMNVCAISKLGLLPSAESDIIVVIENNDVRQWQAVQALRAQGKRVIYSAVADAANAKTELRLVNGEYQVVKR